MASSLSEDPAPGPSRSIWSVKKIPRRMTITEVEGKEVVWIGCPLCVWQVAGRVVISSKCSDVRG